MSQITKRALVQSLKNLLLEKPLSKITVTDIGASAGSRWKNTWSPSPISSSWASLRSVPPG